MSRKHIHTWDLVSTYPAAKPLGHTVMVRECTACSCPAQYASGSSSLLDTTPRCLHAYLDIDWSETPIPAYETAQLSFDWLTGMQIWP
jgi:hypothetical protein